MIAGALGGVQKSNAAVSPPTGGQATNYPSLALSSSYVVTYGAPSTASLLRPALPIRIAWQGFAADLAFYALALAALRWLIIRPWRLAVDVSRMRHGRCIACGYDLGYDFRAGCPECGWRRKDREPVS